MVQAASDQIRRLPDATRCFDPRAEAPTRLATALAERAAGDVDQVYFTRAGSDAVDSSVRFIRHHRHAMGQPGRVGSSRWPAGITVPQRWALG